MKKIKTIHLTPVRFCEYCEEPISKYNRFGKLLEGANYKIKRFCCRQCRSSMDKELKSRRTNRLKGEQELVVIYGGRRYQDVRFR